MAEQDRRLWWSIGGLLVVPLVYVLSAAPLVRLVDYWPYGGGWAIYRPVDWLIDETPLREPLLKWADVWGVRSEFEWARFVRHPPHISPH